MKFTTKKSRSAQPHGIAYVLVLAVVAIATLIGYAMLSGAALQAQASANYSKSAATDYLTESAVQVATYYLQRDLAGMPASWVQAGYKLKASNLTVSGVDGSFDVDATSNSQTDTYDIHVTARSSTSGTTSVTRTSTAKVRVVRVSPTYAVGASGTLTINARNYINGGPVAASNTITLVGSPSLSNGTRSFLAGEYAIPDLSASQVKYYGGGTTTYTTPNGRVGTAQVLSSGTISSPASLTANAANPGKVFYYNGNVTVNGAGTYEGTIIARGKFEVNFPSTTGGTVVMNHVSGFPAIIADGSVSMASKNLNVSINGLIYAGRGTAFATALNAQGTTLKIYGGLIMPNGQSLGNGNQGTLILTYTPANINIDNMSTLNETPIGVQLLDWQQ